MPSRTRSSATIAGLSPSDPSSLRLVLAAVLTIGGGIALTLLVWGPMFDWLVNDRRLFCQYTSRGEGAGAWICPDGVSYVIPGLLGGVACFALAFISAVAATHLTAARETRRDSGSRMGRAGAVLVAGSTVLLVASLVIIQGGGPTALMILPLALAPLVLAGVFLLLGGAVLRWTARDSSRTDAAPGQFTKK